MKSKEIWSKRSKKHVILISQTAHTNPWIYRDPELIMIPAAWLAGGLMKQRATHSLCTSERRTTCKITSEILKIIHCFLRNLQWFITRAHESTFSYNCRDFISFLCPHKSSFFFFFFLTVSPNMPKHLAYDVHKPHRTQRAYQFISHLMAYFKL